MLNPSTVNKNIVLPSPHMGTDGAFSTPLTAVAGELAAAAATANQALTVAAPAGHFGFITDISFICTATSAVAASVSLLDASGGTVLDKFTFGATGPTLNGQIVKRFSVAHKTAALAGQFFITTTGAGVTWSVQANGYYGNLLF